MSVLHLSSGSGDRGTRGRPGYLEGQDDTHSPRGLVLTSTRTSPPVTGDATVGPPTGLSEYSRHYPTPGVRPIPPVFSRTWSGTPVRSSSGSTTDDRPSESRSVSEGQGHQVGRDTSRVGRVGVESAFRSERLGLECLSTVTGALLLRGLIFFGVMPSSPRPGRKVRRRRLAVSGASVPVGPFRTSCRVAVGARGCTGALWERSVGVVGTVVSTVVTGTSFYG